MSLPESITNARTGAEHRADHEALHERFNDVSVLMDSTSLSSAQLLDLHNTAVELLPAPGGRWYYVIHGFVLHYRFVTTPYAGNVQYGLFVGFGSTLAEITDLDIGAAFNPLNNSGGVFFDQTEDYYLSVPTTTKGDASQYSVGRAASLLEDKALSIGIDPVPDSLTDGDGTLSVRTFYSLIDGA